MVFVHLSSGPFFSSSGKSQSYIYILIPSVHHDIGVMVEVHRTAMFVHQLQKHSPEKDIIGIFNSPILFKTSKK